MLRLTNNTGNQVGSAWFNTAQGVQNGFGTSFQFRFTNPSGPPADGIAFVIQNVATNPLNAIGFTGGNGGAIGYGDSDASTDPSSGAGIPNSLAIEFDTFQNGWDPAAVNGSVSHVAIQSCGHGPNTSHHQQVCSSGGPNSTLAGPVVVPNLADGLPHSVTITYALPCPSCSPATTTNTLHVILDNHEVLSVATNLSSIGLSARNTAFVGFTGATGGDFEDQDILNWTFSANSQAGSFQL